VSNSETDVILARCAEFERLVGRQALSIDSLHAEIDRMEDDRRSIRWILGGIGGPLNDNRLGYSPEQLVPFSQIKAHASS
jgi:hypothetical protein